MGDRRRGVHAGVVGFVLVAVVLASATATPQPEHLVASDAQVALEAQTERNLAFASTLAAVASQTHAGDLERSIALAKVGTSWQAATLGVSLPTVQPVERTASPSLAVAALASRVDRPLGSEAGLRAAGLDALSAEVAAAFTDMVVSFLVLDAAARVAFASEGAQAPVRFALGVDGARGLVVEGRSELGGVLAARGGFLDAVLALAEALAWSGAVERGGVGDLCPVMAWDLVGVDSHYAVDCALIVDVGGDDVYHNNAGGSNYLDCPGFPLPNGPAAAVVDYAGNDRYGDPAAPRECGVNGGGRMGAGMLLDGGGDDRYHAAGLGTNGGSGIGGLGFLLDAGHGHDTYIAGLGGTNGGGAFGVGFLLDEGGSDRYSADTRGTNGAGMAGVGFLFDGGGWDTYEATNVATNGGAWTGVGFLLDTTGSDRYIATHMSTNGGGSGGGVGFLMDREGDDTYLAGMGAANGAARGSHPPNVSLAGQPHIPYASGSLIDCGGTDTYEDLAGGTGMDRTVLLKGIVGNQVDTEDCSSG